MTADVITVLAVVAGIIWLGVLLVSTLRNRGGAEEVSANLKPGIDDQQLETRRLENGQRAAIAFSAFLAISLPLYFLGEADRQEGFVDEFSEASITRGEHLVEEFGCFNCHGPLGAGGSAQYVEKRSGITVSWAAPSLDDVFYRFEPDEVNYWITFGRGNTPMPAWGLPGGGPMNEHQVQDLVNYLQTIQIPQEQVVAETVNGVDGQLDALENAAATMEAAIVGQRQVVAEIDQAPGDLEVIGPLAKRASDLLDVAGQGIDTDADGLADAVEQELSQISADALGHFRPFEPPQLDPAVADAELVEQGLEDMRAATTQDPILVPAVTAVEAAVEGDEVTADNPDTDGDGLSDAAENTISGQFAEAVASTLPSELQLIDLDPANPQTVSGVSDRTTASNMEGSLETVAINLRVTVENVGRIKPQQDAGLRFLLDAEEAEEWAVDFEGVAEAMGGTVDEAHRAVGIFNTHCARCHTAGFSAGLPYSQEIGSGGFAPALWDGRPLVQFGPPPEDPEADDLLVEFIINGSEAATPYGINGFGSGRMPSFGAILDMDDIELLARFLRGGNLDGMDD